MVDQNTFEQTELNQAHNPSLESLDNVRQQFLTGDLETSHSPYLLRTTMRNQVWQLVSSRWLIFSLIGLMITFLIWLSWRSFDIEGWLRVNLADSPPPPAISLAQQSSPKSDQAGSLSDFLQGDFSSFFQVRFVVYGLAGFIILFLIVLILLQLRTRLAPPSDQKHPGPPQTSVFTSRLESSSGLPQLPDDESVRDGHKYD